ncbi:MAG: VWA domain-containing protein [Deltaproteobacteria bacterium]|nr:VWA domain-containing protein [Deltaproteobacteria bacterium]
MPDLAKRTILFSHFLRDRGFKIFSSSIVDSLRGLEQIDISIRDDFLAILRANMVTNEAEWKLFSKLFDEFWQDLDLIKEKTRSQKQNRHPEGREDSIPDRFLYALPAEEEEAGSRDEKRVFEGATYSPVELLQRKDLADFERGDIQIAQLILKSMMSPFKIAVTRRFKRSKKPGDIDFRGVLRKGLKAEGIPFELLYRKKRKRLKKLVVLADVSGSMDRYARFVMPFIMGLKGVGPRAEIFVFSTSLTPITPTLRRYPTEKALEIISRQVPDWSGGTRIGYSLHQFNERHGLRLLNKRTVVVIMSDGWDLGAKELLRREMENLARKAYSIIWLNPLAGDPDYKPLCKGMQTALPYVNYFMPANSLESLKGVGRMLSRVMAGA